MGVAGGRGVGSIVPIFASDYNIQLEFDVKYKIEVVTSSCSHGEGSKFCIIFIFYVFGCGLWGRGVVYSPDFGFGSFPLR